MVTVAVIGAAGVVVAAAITVLPNFFQKEPRPEQDGSRGSVTGGSVTAVTGSPGAQVVNGSTVHGNVIPKATPEAKDPAQRIRKRSARSK